MKEINDLDALRAWCLESGIDYPETATARFGTYIELLLKYQQRTNLTGFPKPEAIIAHGFRDSLQLLRAGSLTGPVLDVGSGAGLPALPIKIVHPDLEMHLVEPRTRRYAFLGLVIRTLGLTGIHVHKCRVESLELPITPSTVISKAFTSFGEWLKITEQWRGLGARVGCYVSRQDWERIGDLSSRNICMSGIIEDSDRVYTILETRHK